MALSQLPTFLPKTLATFPGRVPLLEHEGDGDGDEGDDDDDDDIDVIDPWDEVITEISNQQLVTITSITQEMAEAVQAAIGHNAAVTVGTTTAVALGNTTVTNETATGFFVPRHGSHYR